VLLATKDYYEVLGLKRDATEKQIKRRFRELALKYHPDKNKDPKAEEQFRTIAEAYDTLGDATKRRQYDAQGHQSFTSSNQGGGSGGFSGFHFDMNDFFRQFDAASSQFHHAKHQAHHQHHYKSHQHAHNKAHKEAHFGFDFDSLFDDLNDGFETNGETHVNFGDLFSGFGDGGFESELFGHDGNTHIHTKSFTSHVTTHEQCQTVTKREGNRVSTVTECH